jgi:hypothetical protein
MINRFLFFAGLIFFVSCSPQEKFPPFKSEKIDLQMLKLPEGFQFQPRDSIINSVQIEIKNEALNRLFKLQQQYFQKDESFGFENFLQEWNEFTGSTEHLNLEPCEKISWFEINGTLLQITGEAKYAEEMERILQTDLPEYIFGVSKTTDLVAPYIFTKNADHIFVNLFAPAEISYEHTLHGKVKIWQEFPQNQPDSIYLNFEMEERRYIELYVRIPDWAEGATVTVKKVKYIAPPGAYSQIAKKWKTGDVVEIYLPKNKISLQE